MTLYAGVDLGGTTVRAALADGRGDVVAERSAATRSQRGADAVIADLVGLVRGLREEAGAGALGGIGVG
ncbi:MAG: ROK family protein, partial [Acidobacteria bacterium]